ncbi:phosphoesterase PA-phosphatase [Halobiforma lacisalsi AJ5]|uniref:Phosphoesterase PA-phosphatase n=1 Tax=Natronobacterium lacisalsi AJ5 TaxID=358396 RepID=M0LMD2_NATLA|nr:phosphatase PAP2 family protein [Halobiforma lacisalsi]APW97006.1 phosphoesterase PA-phosphatase [Halobiforma lacisalsi AJ5]EMA34722.1 phosphoesterase PA-phosphatase-like protein [Halobiforma lacisalsi AJ5]
MALPSVALVTAVVVAIGLVATCLLCLTAEQVWLTIDTFDRRFASTAPYLAVAAVVFLLKWLTHDERLDLSYAIGWKMTDSIYAVEGTFVAVLQDFVPSSLYGFFSGIYMFGFSYLLFTAAVLTFVLPSQRSFKELLVAYLLNYSLGAVCYTLFVAYGPRNWIPSRVDGVLYDLYPQTQEVTAAVSAKTNVFPSLHTSLSVVVLLFAWRTHGTYPRWSSIATFVASSVVLSTMVLGIHWLLDVVAGVVLGVGSVVAASRIVDRVEGGDPPTASDDRPVTIRSETDD